MRKNIYLSFLLIGFIFSCKIEEDNIVAINPLKDNATKVVEVKSRTGRIWMDRNLGASQVATSSTDALAYGDLYQWGRPADGHQLRTSATTSKLSSLDVPGNALFIIFDFSLFVPDSLDWRKPQNDNLWQGVNGVNNPCPIGFRLPTESEWYEEQKSWLEGINSAGAMASPLKLPMAGVRGLDGRIGIGSGNYWASTYGTGAFRPFLQYSHFMAFGIDNPRTDFNGNRIINVSDRSWGRTVRCIKN